MLKTVYVFKQAYSRLVKKQSFIYVKGIIESSFGFDYANLAIVVKKQVAEGLKYNTVLGVVNPPDDIGFVYTLGQFIA